jgi:HK97 family phage portal protein
MRVFGFDIRRAARPIKAGSGGWGSIREPFTGAWQRNQSDTPPNPIGNPIVFTCIDLIAREIAKMRMRLMTRDDLGVWRESYNSAYSPVLQKPNRYQTFQKFAECWIAAKLSTGNAYVLKERDDRTVVKALYVLDPSAVTPLVAPDGAVYYELKRDDLAGIPPAETGRDGVVVPASEIIHDPMICLFHPLVGVSPLFACAAPAIQGLQIQDSQITFFANGARPSGILVAPGAISQPQADKIKAYWNSEFTGQNAGRVAILSDNVQYHALTESAATTQLVEQLRLSAETIAACYHVPFYIINQAAAPANLSAESLVQLFYSQCLQSLTVAFETSLDEGLGLSQSLGTEFDIDDLIWMDTDSRTKAARDSINAGALSPDEARFKYYGLGPVPGGASPYMQQQYYSLAALSARDQDQPFAKPGPATPPADAAPMSRDQEIPPTKAAVIDGARFFSVLHKALVAQ